MRSRSLFLLLVLVLAGRGILWLTRSSFIRVGSSEAQIPAINLREARIVLRHEGERQAEIMAERVEVSRDLRYAKFLGRPTAIVFEHDHEALRLQAREIVFDRRTNDLTVAGPIEVTSPHGDRLNADSARWEAADQRLVLENSGMLIISGIASGQASQILAGDEGRLRAERLRYDAKMRAFIAEGDVHLVVGDVEIRADRLRLERDSQMAYAFGRVTVQHGGTALAATQVTYGIRTRMAEAVGDVVLTSGESTVSAPRMSFDLAARQAMASGGVTATHQDITISAPAMMFDETSRELKAESVVVNQRGRTARANRLRYLQAAGRLELSGDVVIEQTSGERLVQEGILSPPSDSEAKSMLASKVVVTCDKLVVLTKDDEMSADGSVTVTQTGRSASSDAARYQGRERLLTLTGKVRLQDEDGGRIQADRVVISLADETFEASGNVETEFTVKQGH